MADYTEQRFDYSGGRADAPELICGDCGETDRGKFYGWALKEGDFPRLCKACGIKRAKTMYVRYRAWEDRYREWAKTREGDL